MSSQLGLNYRPGYISQAATLAWDTLRRLMRTPSHSRKAEARRALARRWLMLTSLALVAIILLMIFADAAAIGLMPPRRDPSLWWVRIFTELAKARYVLWTLMACLGIVWLALPRLRGTARALGAALAARIQYVFLSVLVAAITVEILKPLFGRGRPFVGDIGVLNFSPFQGTEAFASLPSSHCGTAWALAFAVAAVWPRIAPLMWVYGVLICVSRVVLLAHHPSDTIAGALVGVLSAMAVRYWFAARGLVFNIGPDGAITAREGPSPAALKRVARAALAP